MIAVILRNDTLGAQPFDEASGCHPEAVSTYRSSRGNAYEVTGCGPAVLVLHGFSADRRMWRDLVPTWRPYARLILADLKSHGASAAARTDDDPIADLLTILQEQRVATVAVIGHSAGAAMAVDLAARAPGRISALVLHAPSVSGFIPRTSVDLSAVAIRVRAGDFAGAAEEWLASSLMATTLAPADTRWFRTMIRENARVWQPIGGPRPAAAASAGTLIARLQMPVLIGLGVHDESGTTEVADAIVTAHPTAVLRRFEGAGHWLPLERPQAVADSTLAFLLRVWCGSTRASGAACPAGSSTAPTGRLAEPSLARRRGTATRVGTFKPARFPSFPPVL